VTSRQSVGFLILALAPGLIAAQTPILLGNYDLYLYTKPPIVNLIFSVQGDPQSIPARIVGLPNADNAIKALVETEPANRLFAGLTGDEHLVTITLTYQDNTIDVLQIRGFSDGTYGGKNSKFSNCLRGYTPEIHGVRPMP
jgi:hypothetical protein